MDDYSPKVRLDMVLCLKVTLSLRIKLLEFIPPLSFPLEPFWWSAFFISVLGFASSFRGQKGVTPQEFQIHFGPLFIQDTKLNLQLFGIIFFWFSPKVI